MDVSITGTDRPELPRARNGHLAEVRVVSVNGHGDQPITLFHLTAFQLFLLASWGHQFKHDRRAWQWERAGIIQLDRLRAANPFNDAIGATLAEHSKAHQPIPGRPVEQGLLTQGIRATV